MLMIGIPVTVGLVVTGFVVFILMTAQVFALSFRGLLNLGVDPVWLAMLITVNLQSSFLTPPFGWALLYLKGVAPPEVNIKDIYKGVVPFIGLQLLTLGLVFLFPQIALWLPKAIGW